MKKFNELNTLELLSIEGGCLGCKIGQALLAIGGTMVGGPVGYMITAVSIAQIFYT
ncbi:MAG: Blp family class II bacteriocin [Oscillospiraceae bacterium]|nr:Blp family class II bacteriocin [Oscillospiraceae bacterium]